jgi:hypothetical protein
MVVERARGRLCLERLVVLGRVLPPLSIPSAACTPYRERLGALPTTQGIMDDLMLEELVASLAIT